MNKSKKNLTMALVPVPTGKTSVAVIQGPNRGNKKKKRKNKKGGAGRAVNMDGLSGGTRAYLNCLNGPFDSEPVRLGYGTMIPTRLLTAYLRISYTTNADGSFQVWFAPGQACRSASAANGGFVMADSAGLTTTPTFGSFNNPANQVSFNADADQYRVVAAGIRLFALQAQTSAPGILASGVLPAVAGSTLPNSTGSTPKTAQAILSFPNARLTKSYDPVQVLWRPDDLNCFEFQSMTNTSSGGAVNNLPVCYIAGAGLPASTTFYVEAVAHYEAYTSILSSAIATDGGSVGGDTVSANGPSSLDSLWATISGRVLPAVQAVGEYFVQNPQQAKSVIGAMFPASDFIRRGHSLEFKEN